MIICNNGNTVLVCVVFVCSNDSMAGSLGFFMCTQLSIQLTAHKGCMNTVRVCTKS